MQLWHLQTMANVDSGRGGGLLDNRLTDVGGNKQVDARSKTIAFLKEFIKEEDEGGEDELNDGEKANASTKVTWLPI